MARRTLTDAVSPRELTSWAYRTFGHDRLAMATRLAGIPDDAAGYAYHEGALPADATLDLYGAPASLKGAESLGDGWWYARPGD